MAQIPKRFKWLAAKDGGVRTHLTLEPGGLYATSSVSAGLLIQWAREGLLAFIEDDPAERLPDDIKLVVQDALVAGVAESPGVATHRGKGK